MPQGFSVISNRDIRVLVDTLNRDWARAPEAPDTIYDKIAYVDRGIGGERVNYWMPVLSGSEEYLKLYEQRRQTFAAVAKLDCEAERISSKEYYIALQSFADANQLLNTYSTELIQQGKKVFDRLLANTIARNPVTYDGKTLFATDHPVNPNEPGYGTFSNDIKVKADEAGLIAAVKRLRQEIRGWDNLLMNGTMGRPLIVTATEELEITFRKVLNPGIVPEQVGTAAASRTNQLAGYADIITFPELALTPNGDKYFYVINRNSTARKPFIIRAQKQPVLQYTGIGDEPDRLRGAMTMYYEGEGGGAAGLPQLVVRCLIQ